MADSIQGKQIRLSENRCVFVASKPGTYWIEFKSKEGSTTRLCLSDDAMYALSALYGATAKGEMKIERSSRTKYEESRWQLAPEIEA